MNKSDLNRNQNKYLNGGIVKMNGNGIIQKNGEGTTYVRVPFAVLAIVVTILIAVIPAVMAYGVLNEKVNTLENGWKEYSSSHTSSIDKIDEKLSDIDIKASGNTISLQEIKEDIQDIKIDLKELRKDISD